MFLRHFIPPFLMRWFRPPQGAELRGAVRQDKEEGYWMPGATVSAAGAQSQVADKEGRFTLKFPQKNPGDVVEIFVTKSGYEVIHSVLLQHALTKDEKAPLAIVIMAKLEKREDMARGYFVNQGSLAARQSKLGWLEKPQKPSEEEVKTKVDRALLVLVHLAPVFAKEEREENSIVYRRALRLFVEQKVDEALQILPSEAWLANKQEPPVNDRMLAREFQLKGRVLMMAFRFDEALKAYDNAVAAAPDDFEARHEVAVVLDTLLRPGSEVLPAYDRALKAARAAGFVDGMARTLESLGHWHRIKGKAEDARAPYEEAVLLYRELEKKGHATAVSQLQFILENLGFLYQKEDRKQQAIQAFEEALQMAEILDRRNPGLYLASIAFSSTYLGRLYADEKRHGDARRAYERSKSIYQSLCAKGKKEHLEDLAQEYCNLTLLSLEENRSAEAKSAAAEAIKIYRQLEETSPDAFAIRISSLQELAGL